jgi:hypothetical protein
MENSDIGPCVPPDFELTFGDADKQGVNGLKTDDPSQSALKESIKKKGGNSYYYAHNYDGQNFNNEKAK